MRRIILQHFFSWGIKPLRNQPLTRFVCKNYFVHNGSLSCNKNIDIFRRNLSTSLIVRRKKSSEEDIQEEVTEKELFEDNDFSELMVRMGGTLNGINYIAVLQPWIKWGPKKRTDTNREMLLAEACALVQSLPFSVVSYKEVVPLARVKNTYIFGKGSLKRIKNELSVNRVQAVFISLDHITRPQKCTLEEQFGVPVFDRYFIVLSIFKHHANTIESRLQIAMAELPFMNKRYKMEKERMILNEREAKLKNALKKIESRREKARNNRKNLSLPSVAVVGYTNCGKTTLIRALTGDEKLQGENRLFATLDVTAHRGVLPCGLGTVFMDSVGFIQNIPTTLIASFKATLQDTIYADVVVHVRDISHPDIFNQTKIVEETLKSLPLPEGTPVVVVNNKADLLEDRSKMDENIVQSGIFTSCVSGEGLNETVEQVQEEILRVTQRKKYRMKFLTGSPQIEWLKRMTGVYTEEVDEEDSQYTRIYVVLNEAEKAAFRKFFQTNQKR